MPVATAVEAPDPALEDEYPTGLDNLTLSRKEDWQRFIQAPARVRPEQLTTTDLHALDQTALARYNRRRRDWHANLGPIKTPQ